MNKAQANLILDQVKVGVPYPHHIINQALTVSGDLNGKISQNIERGLSQYYGVWGLHRETTSQDVYKD
jgi:hypothetical protein